MKPPDEAKRRIVVQWLQKADHDCDLAEHLFAEGARFPSAIVFHCQQAVEKYIKAMLVRHAIGKRLPLKPG
jgi:HEPN domain-containing protein